MSVQFTGEYLIPGQSPQRMEDDHLERYKFAAHLVSGKTVLDIACGSGYGTQLLAEAGASRVHGVDISEEVIQYAQEHYRRENSAFFTSGICEYQTDIRYDVITCFETIEHVDDYQGALSNLSSRLHDDGILLISTPNRLITSPRTRSIHDKPSNKFHVREFSLEEFLSTLKKHGFRVRDTEIFGQRLQRYFKNAYMRQVYTALYKPKERSSPLVNPVGGRMPRYFVLIARKDV